MSTASLAKVKARLSAYITQCQRDGPVVITRNGKPVVVMIAPEDEEDLEQLLIAYSPRIQAIFEPTCSTSSSRLSRIVRSCRRECRFGRARILSFSM